MSQVVNVQECVRVSPARDIVAGMTNEFKSELEAVVASGVNGIVIDLEGVEMIDSVGLGVLISIHNQLRANGGKLAIKNPSSDIFALFRTMRLNHHFEMISD